MSIINTGTYFCIACEGLYMRYDGDSYNENNDIAVGGRCVESTLFRRIARANGSSYDCVNRILASLRSVRIVVKLRVRSLRCLIRRFTVLPDRACRYLGVLYVLLRFFCGEARFSDFKADAGSRRGDFRVVFFLSLSLFSVLGVIFHSCPGRWKRLRCRWLRRLRLGRGL